MKNTLKIIWQNRKQILEGITNTVIRDETVEEIARLRYSICDECPSKGKDCAVKGTAPCCDECGCSLTFKTRSLSSSCPHPEGPKWEALITEEEEDKLEAL
jgi:hypothetical protein